MMITRCGEGGLEDPYPDMNGQKMMSWRME